MSETCRIRTVLLIGAIALLIGCQSTPKGHVADAQVKPAESKAVPDKDLEVLRISHSDHDNLLSSLEIADGLHRMIEIHMNEIAYLDLRPDMYKEMQGMIDGLGRTVLELEQSLIHISLNRELFEALGYSDREYLYFSERHARHVMLLVEEYQQKLEALRSYALKIEERLPEDHSGSIDRNDLMQMKTDMDLLVSIQKIFEAFPVNEAD